MKARALLANEAKNHLPGIIVAFFGSENLQIQIKFVSFASP